MYVSIERSTFMPGEAPTQNKELFRALVEHNSDAIMLITSDGIITYANPATARLTGYTSGDLEGMDSLTLIHPDDQRNLKEHLTYLIQQDGKAFSLEYRLCCKDATWKSTESTITESPTQSTG